MFHINPRLDRVSLRTKFDADGRLGVDQFLCGDAAQLLYDNLRERSEWKEVLNSGDKLIELDRTTQQKLTPAKRDELAQAVYAQAREEFQYRYESIRVTDDSVERAATNDILAKFAEWMSAGEAREFLGDITGLEDIEFADAQATAYSPGHFLTGHDDDFAGKNRLAAYVFNLCPIWRTEWGGLLIFHEENKGINGFAPGFNRLNIFKVPQMHSVTEVTRSAPYRRYAITGWLRTRP